MRCKICKDKAIINIYSYKLALCERCLVNRIEKKTEETIKKYRMFNRKDKILIAISGGKDSLALAFVLKKLNYNIECLYIDLGIEHNQYSAISKEKSKNFCEKENIKLNIVDIKKNLGNTIDELIKRRKKICSLCGQIKRYFFNYIPVKKNIKIVVTGHNLDDEASTLFSNTLRWDKNYLIKQYPVLESEADNITKKVKPFCFLTEKEIAVYCIVNNIDYIQQECPYAISASSIRYKYFLNELDYKSRGVKLKFYKNFLKAKKENFFIQENVEIRKDTWNKCINCGMPTNLEECFICRFFKESKKEEIEIDK